MVGEFLVMRDQQQYGPFTETEICDFLAQKRFQLTDLVWKAGMKEWQPIHRIFRVDAPAALSTRKTSLELPDKTTIESSLRKLFQAVPTPVVVLVLAIAGLKLFGVYDSVYEPVRPNPTPHANSYDSIPKTVPVAQTGALSSAPDSTTSKLGSRITAVTQSTTPVEKQVTESISGNQIFQIWQAAKEMVGSSVEREDACRVVEQKYLGRTYEFEGKIRDVLSSEKIVIELDSDNHANVFFSEPSLAIRKLKKNTHIKIAATLADFGTGILIKHDLSDAVILP